MSLLDDGIDRYFRITDFCSGHLSQQPKLTNFRQDPFERMNWPSGGFANGSIAYYDSVKHEMWRFVIPGQVIAKYLPSFIEFPPMQAGGSFKVSDL
jgi:hypothetical protein